MKCKNCIEEIKKLKTELSKYKQLSLTDHLTFLWNRRKFDIDIVKYNYLNDRYKIKYLLVFIDVDNLKQINDTDGHKAGDIAIQKVANALKNNIRKGDNAYRLGGDEFALILHHSPKENKYILKRIRKILRKHKVSISIGFNKLGDNAINKADEKLYIEKRRKKKNV